MSNAAAVTTYDWQCSGSLSTITPSKSNRMARGGTGISARTVIGKRATDNRAGQRVHALTHSAVMQLNEMLSARRAELARRDDRGGTVRVDFTRRAATADHGHAEHG